MSLAELHYFWMLDMCETLADVDRVLYDAENEGWHEPSSIHLRAASRKATLANLTRRRDAGVSVQEA